MSKDTQQSNPSKHLIANSDDELRFEQLIEALPNVAVQGYNSQREVIYWNEGSENLYGYSQQEAIGRKLEELIIPEPMREGVIEAHHAWVSQGVKIPASELELRHKDGRSVFVFSSHVMLKQDTADPEMFCVDVDLTPQHEARQQLERLAIQDVLTHLPNRRFVEEELERRLADASRLSQSLGVLFIDLDHFKEVNATLGHYAGDMLLQEVAERMSAKLRQCDHLARFGGDEFVLLLPVVDDQVCIAVVAEKLLSAFSETFPLGGQDIYMTASIGVSVFPGDGDSVSTLLQNADAAMYRAKEQGGNRYQFFNRSMNNDLHRQRAIVNGLHRAFQQEEFSLVYQPQIDLKTQTIRSCEALLRWKPSHRDAQISPEVFIPIAERSDLILRIGTWVVNEACRQLAEWRTQGISDLRVDINVSGMQIAQPDFVDTLMAALNHYGLSAQDLGIELTENVLASSSNDTLMALTHARRSGMEISIDDFGTGYSSFSYLKVFPVHTLKIDRSFVEDAPHKANDAAIMEGMVTIGHKLGLKIVAEGIDSAAQQALCESLGCDLGQGYYFHRPLPPGALTNLILSAQRKIA